MTAIDVRTPAHPPTRTARKSRWTPAHSLAAIGAVLLFWGGWTIIAWLAHEPTTVTEFRDTDHISWYLARFYEALSVILTVGLGGWVLRGCLREKRLTFDAKLCLAGATAYWVDPLINAVQPIFNYSSQWVNVRNWCSQMPLVVNPDCGRMPEPWLHIFPVYAFGLLAIAIVMNAFKRTLLQRWPDMRRGPLLFWVFVLGAALDIVWELPIIVVELWAFPGYPNELTVFGHGAHRFPITEVVAASIIFTAISALRFYKNDRGETLVERGLDHLSSRRRNTIIMLALCGVTNGLFFIGVFLDVAGGIYSHDGYPTMPRHLVNDMCDAPGVTGTRYGTCPGDPGYRAPIRELPGENP